MLRFIKYIFQLLLSPSHGWEDIEKEQPDPEELLRAGLYPLMGIAAATEFLAFAWHRHIELAEVLMRALADFGTYFVSVFIAKLIFELYLKKVTAEAPDERRSFTLIVLGIGLMVLIQIIDNCIPWNMVVLKFLPLYAVLVIYKASGFIGVRQDDELRFMGIAAGVIVVVPLLIYNLFYLLIA